MRCDAPAFYQRGAALILMMFILGMAALAYTVKSMNAASMQLAQDAKTMVALGQAKEALIAWSVAHKNWPGIMPFPDRLETTSPNYDGKSDCVTNGLNNSHLIGKLPLLGDSPCISPQDGLGVEAVDSSGERFWYAVSKNLIRTSGSANTPIINPGVINVDILKPMPYDGTATTSAYPWLVVKDKRGVVISDRVAVVIIAPGAPLEGQDRISGISPISAYLDNLTVNGEVYSNRDYDQDDEDFIMGDTTTQSLNDRLVFITIDELMYALEKRVAQEAKKQLKNYYLGSSATPVDRYYPYAANVNNACEENKLSGFLPIQPSMATCTSAQACTLSFPMTQVKFTLDVAENYDAKSGACANSGNTCTCWGDGACTKSSAPARAFSCNSNGSCVSAGVAPDGSFTFTYTSNLPSATNVDGSCLGGGGTVTCIDAGTFESPVTNCTATKKWLENLPLWFLANHWQDYIYYEWSPTSSLQSDGKTGISALLIATGAPIVNAPFSFKGSAQFRPSNNIDDYLDSEENINGDSKFEATNKQETHIYNDQVFIVAP